MCFVYSHAKAVLILDEWLRQIPSTAPVPVVLSRTYQSNWIKRLWTHQEGFFPPELWVQFSDRSIEMQSITDMAREYEQSMIPKGIYLKFPSIAIEKVALQYGFFEQAYKNIAAKKEDIWRLYLPLTDIMRVRRTTMQADETVCLATILNIPLSPYQEIQEKDDETTAGKRMEWFLKDINKFPMGLIFNNYERLKTPGFGWAPKTLLAHRSGQESSEIGVLDDRVDKILWDKAGQPGLPVEYPGFSTFEFSSSPRASPRMSISGGNRAFAIRSDRGKLYKVELFHNDVEWQQDVKLSMILSELPEKTDDGSVLAVIGSNACVYQGRHVIKHLALARVRCLKESPGWLDVVTGELLPSSSKWLVR